jgi:hypothetical protein
MGAKGGTLSHVMLTPGAAALRQQMPAPGSSRRVNPEQFRVSRGDADGHDP